jgi:hypothetical protein
MNADQLGFRFWQVLAIPAILAILFIRVISGKVF